MSDSPLAGPYLALGVAPRGPLLVKFVAEDDQVHWIDAKSIQAVSSSAMSGGGTRVKLVGGNEQIVGLSLDNFVLRLHDAVKAAAEA